MGESDAWLDEFWQNHEFWQMLAKIKLNNFKFTKLNSISGKLSWDVTTILTSHLIVFRNVNLTADLETEMFQKFK